MFGKRDFDRVGRHYNLLGQHSGPRKTQRTITCTGAVVGASSEFNITSHGPVMWVVSRKPTALTFHALSRKMPSNTARQKRSVFVIMPFTKTPLRDPSDLTEFFETNVKHCIESDTTLEHQYIVRRSDDTFDITAQIIRDVYTADIVLCDLSGENANPNVMYELGIRLAISNKPVILFREANPKNRPIFDIAGFYAFEYRPQQYRRLEQYIIGKLKKFETGEEVYESPVLKVLRTEPSIISELNRSRVETLLDSFHSQVRGLHRIVGGALHEFLTVYNITHDFDTPEDALAFMQEHRETLAELPWANLVFVPHAMPGLNAFLVELPLKDLLPTPVARAANTFVSEYYNHFLASQYSWHRVSFATLFAFVGESYILRQVLAGCRGIVGQNLPPDEEQKVLQRMREVLSESMFGIPLDEWPKPKARRRKAAKKKKASTKRKAAPRSKKPPKKRTPRKKKAAR